MVDGRHVVYGQPDVAEALREAERLCLSSLVDPALDPVLNLMLNPSHSASRYRDRRGELTSLDEPVQRGAADSAALEDLITAEQPHLCTS